MSHPDRKRDRVIPKFWRKKATAVDSSVSPVNTPVSSTTNVQSVLTSSSPPSGASGKVTVSDNKALELALQQRLDKLEAGERAAFLTAYNNINQDDLLRRVQDYDDEHRNNSLFRPQAERLSKVLSLLDRAMGGVSIAIQANPDISSIVVGGARVIVDLALSFVMFFGKLSDMLCKFEDYLPPLGDYARNPGASSALTDAAAGVYGEVRRGASHRQFWRSQWEPFETKFGAIDTSLQHHLDVLLHAGQAQLLQDTREAKQERLMKEREDLLNWLSTVDFERVHDTIYAKKHAGTAEWVLQRKEFQDWSQSPTSSLLWCYGKPGAGKSVIASNVIERLTTQCTLEDNTILCFAYFDYRMTNEQNFTQIMAAIIKQLCQQLKTTPPRLLEFKRQARNPSAASSLDTIIKLAEDADLKRLYIVLDALDECEEQERPRFLQFIITILDEMSAAKVFVTSRKETDIQDAFENIKAPIIAMQAAHLKDDIERYVQSEVKGLRKGRPGMQLKVKSDALEQKIITTLTDKADGMFLWVDLQLQNLCRVSLAKMDQLVLKALDQLPTGLDETYERILRQIEDQDDFMTDLALSCLTWTFYAQRPLRTYEMESAMRTHFHLQQKDFYDAENDSSHQNKTTDSQEALVVPSDTIPQETMLKACCNLLVVENNFFRPIHYSAQEFFTQAKKAKMQNKIRLALADVESRHYEIANVCIESFQHLEAPLEAFENNLDVGDFRNVEEHFDILGAYEILEANRITTYALRYFDQHLRSSSPSHGLEASTRLLERDPTALAAVLQLRYLRTEEINADVLKIDQTKLQPITYTVTASLFVCATKLFNIEGVKSKWLGSDYSKYTLHHAARAGNLGAISHLIDNGCDIDEKDNGEATPLYLAANLGNLTAVELLLEKGANVNVQGGYWGNALQAAVEGSHLEIVKRLLAAGADINAQGGEFGNALQTASMRGSEDMVRLLIEKGAAIDAEGGSYVRALLAASREGYENIVSILIKNGADIHARSEYYGNALQAACRGGYEDVVSLLIDNGADVNVQCGEFGNALQAASIAGSQNIVKLLIEKGVDINRQGGYYNDALQAAACAGDEEIVSLLISKGAHANAQGGVFGSALQAASVFGLPDTCSALLKAGADVNAGGGHYGSALLAASYRGHPKIVKLLLDGNVNLSVSSEMFANALAASMAGLEQLKGEGKFVDITDRLVEFEETITLLQQAGLTIPESDGTADGERSTSQDPVADWDNSDQDSMYDLVHRHTI